MSLIKNIDKLCRPIDFTGLKGACTGTDIDNLLEFDNKYLFLNEVKEYGKELSIGQELALTRIINAWEDSGKIGYIAFLWHNPDVDVILLNECIVVKVYKSKQWIDVLNSNITYLRYLQILKDRYGIKRLDV